MERRSPGGLSGRRVGLLESRRAQELARLIEGEGGEVLHAPCLREVRVEDAGELAEQLAEIDRGDLDVGIFLTGVGVAALFELAAELGASERLRERLAEATLVARGPKPLAALHRAGLRGALITREPHTTAEITERLQEIELTGRRVAVQHHGEVNAGLVRALAARGAQVINLVTYRWGLPEDTRPVAGLLSELAAGRLDFVAFTSAAQVHNLLAIAAESGSADATTDWLNQRTLVAAIGPSCAAALRERGVEVRVQPARPKMVPLVRAMSDAATVSWPPRT